MGHSGFARYVCPHACVTTITWTEEPILINTKTLLQFDTNPIIDGTLVVTHSPSPLHHV